VLPSRVHVHAVSNYPLIRDAIKLDERRWKTVWRARCIPNKTTSSRQTGATLGVFDRMSWCANSTTGCAMRTTHISYHDDQRIASGCTRNVLIEYDKEHEKTVIAFWMWSSNFHDFVAAVLHSTPVREAEQGSASRYSSWRVESGMSCVVE